ncbi:YpiF family protein [Bacillus sp. V5-8f]|uniref:YpiF family protein n=1 Tax=Bacillus sp. V5-8f TaxID=2053044 RepID=UPI0015E14B12|nr:YpiF family protein [Bacillus sp. V5-8f]
MKWTPRDLKTFDDAKEYIDTVVVPLIPVSLQNDRNQSASMYEFIDRLTGSIENQFKGRVMLMPPLSYLASGEIEQKMEAVHSWRKELESFKYIYFITSDNEWKAYEQDFEGTLIWMPSIPLEHLDEGQARSMIVDQARQIFNLFTRKWKES